RRLLALRSFPRGLEYAETAYQTVTDPNIKAEAGLLLARHSRFDKPIREIIALLDDVIEHAAATDLQLDGLGLRATYHARAARLPGLGARTREARLTDFVDDLEAVLTYAPQGSAPAVEALFRLGSHFLDDELERSLDYFRRLQQVKAVHHRSASAWYLPALALVRRGEDGDHAAAAAMLDTLTEVRPDGPYTLGAYFWLARIAE